MSTLFVIKLITVPLLLWVISWISKRYGVFVASILAGLPATSGPVSFFITLEQGKAFGIATSVNILPGICACVAFAVFFSWMCRKVHWAWTFLAASVFYFLFAWLMAHVPKHMALWALMAFAAPLFALYLLPKAANAAPTGQKKSRGPWASMAMGASLLLIETGIAPFIGTLWSGLIIFYPLISGVVGLFACIDQGPDGALRSFKGSITGTLGGAVFAIVVAYALPYWSIGESYGMATIATLLSCLVIAWVLKRLERR